MNALVCATRDAAIMQSQAWIDAEGRRCRSFCQKIPQWLLEKRELFRSNEFFHSINE